jgi:rRNA maturation endonuclease Nob1
MADIIETIKQEANELLSGLDQKGQIRSAIEGIRSQWTERERRHKIHALENQIQTQRAEMKQMTEALGLQALSLYETGAITNPEIARLCERITELRTEIDAQKAEADRLKADLQATAQAQTEARALQKAARVSSTCSQCGTAIPSDAEFCHKCGAQQLASSSAPVASAPAPSAPAPQQGTVVRLRCPQCKAILPMDAEFCSSCGVKFRRPAQASTPSPNRQATSGKQFCPSCGAETKPNARFCPICGQSIA